MWLAVSDCPNQCPRDPARRVTLRHCPSSPVQPVIQLSRFLPSSPRTPRLQFQAACRNVCLARSSSLKGHTLPTGPPMCQATECLDCRGAQGVIPDDLNPTAWEAACRNAKGRVETFRNNWRDRLGSQGSKVLSLAATSDRIGCCGCCRIVKVRAVGIAPVWLEASIRARPAQSRRSVCQRSDRHTR